MNSILIPKQRLRAMKYYSPLLIFIALFSILSFIASAESAHEYLTMTQIDVALLNLAIFTYGMPLLVFIVCIYAVIKWFNVYKYRLNPPPNLPLFKDTISKTPKCHICLFILSILCLLFSMYLVYFGHGVYNEILSNKST